MPVDPTPSERTERAARYFPSAAAFRRWLERHHATKDELLVGFHKRHTGAPSMTWSESVDEALCFGWIDGVRRSVDADRYTIRFTPRRPTSTWSAVNVAKMKALEEAGRMTDAGRAAFAKKSDARSGVYSYEQRPAGLPAELRRVLDASAAAARDFDARPPWYRRAATWWVVSAKTELTRQRRLVVLVERHERGETIPPLTRTQEAKGPKPRGGQPGTRRARRP